MEVSDKVAVFWMTKACQRLLGKHAIKEIKRIQAHCYCLILEHPTRQALTKIKGNHLQGILLLAHWCGILKSYEISLCCQWK